MDRMRRLISTIEDLVSTKKKRHIVGGILLSTSIFLGGLAVTVMSTKVEDNEVMENDDEYDDY